MKIIFLVILFFTASENLFADEFDSKLKQVPFTQRVLLKGFFKEMLERGQAGHVLFFEEKPVCIAAAPCIKPPKQPKDGYFMPWRNLSAKNHKFIHVWSPFFDKKSNKQWKAWKKYEHLFQSDNFFFCEERFELGDSSTRMHIILVNKRSLKKCLEKYYDIFNEQLGAEFSAENFIALLEERKQLRPLIKNNEYLFGILLGYGPRASHIFSNRNVIHPAPMKAKQPTLCPIFPVAFMGDPQSGECNNLVDVYTSELEEIWDLYKRVKKNPLQLGLRQFNDDQS